MVKIVSRFMLILFVVMTASCGDKNKEEKKNDFQTVRKKEEKVVKQEENVIALGSNDMMQFDKKELRVKAGKEVTLTLTHTGKLDKLVMGHNFVLLKQGTDISAFGNEAVAAKDNDYIPEGTDAVIVNTKVIGGGESTTITFDPPAAGTYDFICSFPGHYGVMQGKFVVE